MRVWLLALTLIAPLAAQSALSGAARLRISLEKLNKLGRVLHIAAHPDDENTALLAISARGWLYRTAYLSLTRGEGGQNLIGSEQGDGMGLIRTQELLAARRIDGAEQYFARAIDFGFTKTAAETFSKWDREQILGDVVHVIRTFQPDVIVLRFSGTPRDGHGQHQASALLGKEAFEAAADPKRFPEPGLKPWRAHRLVLNLATFTPAMEKDAAATPGAFAIDLGAYDPVLGASFGEIAGISRSQHRSQAMGWRQDRGSQRNYFQVLAGPSANGDLMDGIDTSWKRVPGAERAGALLAKAAAAFDDRTPEAILPLLLDARRELAHLNGSFAEEKRAALDRVILDAAGLFLDATSGSPVVVAGASMDVAFTAIRRGAADAELVAVSVAGRRIPIGKTLPRGAAVSHIETLIAPEQATQPYWLAQPRSETMYAIADRKLLDRPDGPPALSATLEVRIGGETIPVELPVGNRYVDRIYGELTRPLVVAPPVVARIVERVVLFPDRAPRDVSVQVTGQAAGVSGSVRLAAPDGWMISPAEAPFQVAAAGEQATLRFRVTPPLGDARASLRVEVNSSGKRYGQSMTTIAYPHIPPQTVFAPAEAKLVRAQIAIRAKRIGYVMGSGDEVPGALEQLGCTVTLLTPEALSGGDLSHFDAIVTGVRAFNTRADVRANARRLHEYAALGGTLVVQYNVAEGGFFGGNPKLLENLGPFPITLSAGRVTVEDSPVEFAATNPVLQSPNRITAADFDGWVQERGLYFASAWDPKYETLFSMHDPGEQPLRGGTLLARTGRGAYVFTPLSWFRQLPAGVPGAYRIFANLLSAGSAK